MDLGNYCSIIVEPILSMLVDIYKQGGISFEDAQRIGASFSCTSSFLLVEQLIDEFDLKLEKVRKLKERWWFYGRKEIKLF